MIVRAGLKPISPICSRHLADPQIRRAGSADLSFNKREIRTRDISSNKCDLTGHVLTMKMECAPFKALSLSN